MKLCGHKTRQIWWQSEGKTSWPDLYVLSLKYMFLLTLYDSEKFHYLLKWCILRNLVSQTLNFIGSLKTLLSTQKHEEDWLKH